MANPISTEIDRQKRQEEQEKIAVFTRNEAAMRDHLGIAARFPLTDKDKARLVLFVQWCGQHRVRHCPARPAVVATFISEYADQGAEIILQTLEAIERLHDFHGMANPTTTASVRIMLEMIIDVDPPRSWPAADKVLFDRLPPEIKGVIAERERTREIEIRRLQNSIAAMRKDGTASIAVNVENKTMPNFTKAKCDAALKETGVTQVKTDFDGGKAKDISGAVDRAQENDNAKTFSALRGGK